MRFELALDSAPDISIEINTAMLEQAGAVALEAAVGDDADHLYELAVRLVGNDESAALNGRYRDKPHATNVLSFPAGAELPGVTVLGDLVICLPAVAREAEAQDKLFAVHLVHMIVHGILHLLGYDHIGDDDADRMEALERRIMAGLGHDDPYRERNSA